MSGVFSFGLLFVRAIVIVLNPASVFQFANLRARNRGFEPACEHEPDIATLAFHIFDRQPRNPPTAVDLPPRDIGHMRAHVRHRIAQPHQHKARSKRGVHADVMVLHLQCDDIAAKFGGKLIEQRVCGGLRRLR